MHRQYASGKQGSWWPCTALPLPVHKSLKWSTQKVEHEVVTDYSDLRGLRIYQSLAFIAKRGSDVGMKDTIERDTLSVGGWMGSHCCRSWPDALCPPQRQITRLTRSCSPQNCWQAELKPKLSTVRCFNKYQLANVFTCILNKNQWGGPPTDQCVRVISFSFFWFPIY